MKIPFRRTLLSTLVIWAIARLARPHFLKKVATWGAVQSLRCGDPRLAVRYFAHEMCQVRILNRRYRRLARVSPWLAKRLYGHYSIEPLSPDQQAELVRRLAEELSE